MNVYISADIEVLAAVEGARDAGADRIVVSDSHGDGLNLLIERFPDDGEIGRTTVQVLS
jgi:D-aminopeptidase